MTTLANEIGDYPMLFPLLEVLDGEARYLRPSEAATEENRDHGVVAFRTHVLTAERCEESLPLVGSQPIPDAHSMLLYSLDSPDSGRKIGTQKSALRRFIRESPNSGEMQVDRAFGLSTDTQPTSPRYSIGRTSNYCSHRHRRALSPIDAQPLHLSDQGRPRQTQPSSSAIPATDYTFRLLESLKDVRTHRLFQSDRRG